MGVSANMEAPHYLKPCVNKKVVIRIKMGMVVNATKRRIVTDGDLAGHVDMLDDRENDVHKYVIIL